MALRCVIQAISKFHPIASFPPKSLRSPLLKRHLHHLKASIKLLYYYLQNDNTDTLSLCGCLDNLPRLLKTIAV